MKLYSNILGEGAPLLILHGFLGMSDNWKTLGKEFADAGFQVHLIDQRNHGRSPHSEDFSYLLMAKDIKEYCDAHKLENCILLGHSMGGKTAMLAASLFPHRSGARVSTRECGYSARCETGVPPRNGGPSSPGGSRKRQTQTRPACSPES